MWSSKVKQSAQASAATMNLTPLIDVVFVTLFTFILIAPAIKSETVQLPASQHAHTSSSKPPITITVDAKGAITVNGKKIDAAHLTPHFRTLRTGGGIPLIQHDVRAPFGVYCSLRSALEEAGFEVADLQVDPKTC